MTDDGGTANGGINTVSESFLVTVTPINQSPTINPIANPAPIFENPPRRQTVSLTGISAGLGDTGQTMTVSAVSSNPALIPNPRVNYTTPSTTGTLTYQPVPNASGTATITVTVKDNGGTANGGINTFAQIFTVTVTAVNQPPTINAIPSVSIVENRARRPCPVGDQPGPRRHGQTLTIVATSSNPTLIPTPRSPTPTPARPVRSPTRRRPSRAARP